jgi:Holliday junction resolvase RusA-like endonuclease
VAITFTVHGDPVPQPRARVSTRGGFARAYIPRQHPVHAYRDGIAITAKTVGATVTENAVSVTILATFGRPKSHMNKLGLKKTAPLLPREDVDNLAKSVLDALTGVAWHDDKQVSCLHVSKQYGTAGATEVTIAELS